MFAAQNVKNILNTAKKQKEKQRQTKKRNQVFLFWWSSGNPATHSPVARHSQGHHFIRAEMQPREQGCCLQFCFSCFYSLFTFFLTHPPLLALVTNIVFALSMERKEREKRLHDQFITHKAVAFSLYPIYSNILDKTKKQKEAWRRYEEAGSGSLYT